MATLEQLAPELSKFLTEKQAKAMADTAIKNNAPAICRKLDDLKDSERKSLFQYLKWLGKKKRPLTVSKAKEAYGDKFDPNGEYAPDYIDMTPKQVARYLKMELSYLLKLRAERDAFVGDIVKWGANAFVAKHPTLDTPKINENESKSKELVD